MINYFQTLVNFSPEEIIDLENIIQSKKVAKGNHLIREGKICDFIAYVQKGCLRCYFLKEDGTEMTDNFSFEDDFITDYHSYLTQSPSLQNTMALEDAELLILRKKDVESLYQKSLNFQELGRLMAENLYVFSYQRVQSLLTENAEEKYLRLIRQRPQLLNRVQHYYVASYLGISPETLSRIRKKIYVKETKKGKKMIKLST